MNALRLLMAVLWLALGLTATAHAAPVAAEPPCHMDMHHHKAPQPLDAQMPCCSQPVVIGLPAPVVLTVRRVTYLRRMPAPVEVLLGRFVPFDPHPPKAA